MERGRIAYDNIRKVIFMLISTGAAEVIVVTLAVVARLALFILFWMEWHKWWWNKRQIKKELKTISYHSN